MSALDGPLPKPTVVGWWDYVFDGAEAARIVVVDMEGAGRLGCATVPGDQLKHLGCPLDGPCEHDLGGSA